MKAVALAGAALAALALAAPASAAFEVFRTPSGNIGCEWTSSPAYLRCDIGTGLRPFPPRPAGCELDWGFGLSLSTRGRAKVVCAGDTAIDPRARVLRYGTSWRRGGFACTSEAAGLTCVNAAGHGFFLSKERWRRI